MIRIAVATGVARWVVASTLIAITAGLAGPADAAQRRSREAAEPPPPPPTLSGPARLAVVSIARQRVTLYDAEGNTVRGPISSGSVSNDTPIGVYSILQKKVEHTSNRFDDAQMPHMQRITWSGVALHAGVLPGYPASHGCIRLNPDFAERIFDMTNLGMRVVISRNDIRPANINHPLLFQPKQLGAPEARLEKIAFTDNDLPLMPNVQNWSARQSEQDRLKGIAAEKNAAAREATEYAETFKPALDDAMAQQKKIAKPLKNALAAKAAAQKQIERAEKSLATATKPKVIEAATAAKAKAQEALAKAEAKLKPIQEEADKLAADVAAAKAAFDKAEAAKVAAVDAAKEADRKLLPVSVFVSRATQRLYIRQGHNPVADFPVTILNPDQAIGTHVFTALGYTQDGNAARWNVVSLAAFDDPNNVDETSLYRKKRSREIDEVIPTTDTAAAAAALDRIVIPADLRERFSEYVWPGSSLIISDEPAHKKETNNFTDFVVLLKGYPQGGILRRPDPPPAVRYYDDGDFGGFFFFGSRPQPPRYVDRYGRVVRDPRYRDERYYRDDPRRYPPARARSNAPRWSFW